MERGLKARAIVAVAAVEWNPASSRESLGNTGENPDGVEENPDDVEWNFGVVAEQETVVVELDDNVVVIEAVVVEFEGFIVEPEAVVVGFEGADLEFKGVDVEPEPVVVESEAVVFGLDGEFAERKGLAVDRASREVCFFTGSGRCAADSVAAEWRDHGWTTGFIGGFLAPASFAGDGGGVNAILDELKSWFVVTAKDAAASAAGG